MDLNRAEWRKSSKSGNNGGNCVEVARSLRGIVAVRDSKNPDGPKLIVSPVGWRTFMASVKAGRYDLA
jgi:ABC-type amino acid transport substrate-binding protein